MTEDFDIRRSRSERENDYENVLRPLSFDDFKGQSAVVENLRVFVMAASICAAQISEKYFSEV